VLQGFSEALMIGIIAGTYPSIYISSAIALDCGLTAEHVFRAKRKPLSITCHSGRARPCSICSPIASWLAFITLATLEIAFRHRQPDLHRHLVGGCRGAAGGSASHRADAPMLTRIALLYSIVC